MFTYNSKQQTFLLHALIVTTSMCSK